MSSELTIEIAPINDGELIKNSQQIINQLTAENLLKLQEYVLDNLATLDGGPSISNIEIVNFKYNSANQTGSFRLKFQIDRQYCCSDVQACANDYLDFDFKIKENILLAHTEYFDWSLTN